MAGKAGESGGGAAGRSLVGACRVALGAAIALLVAAPAFAREEISLFRLGPENIGTYGRDVDHLYVIILWIVTVAFVVTESLLVYFLFRFRARPGGKAVYTHGNHRLELIWTLLPGAILFWLALYQMGTWKEIKITHPDPKQGPVIEVMGKQFEWRVRYAGPDGVFGTDDDITMTNNIYVPVDTKVTILLRSQDVIHSFFLPNLRLKQDAVPGLTIQQWFEVANERDASGAIVKDRTTEAERKRRKESGDPDADKFEYEIACAELCGLGHTTMRGFLHVLTKEEFFKWVDATYVKDILPYGTDANDLINRNWPADQNKFQDSWLRDNWPADLKAKWPKK
jgi:cytochrome c oxidase subunit 2